MMLSAELAGKSGAMVFRQAPKPQASPPSRIRNSRSLDCRRSSKCGRPASLSLNAWIGPANATRSLSPSNSTFLDFAKSGVALVPGGIYRAKLADQEIVFKIDPDAKPGDAPLLGRLARLQARR